MNCHDFHKEIMLYHAGELPPERKEELDRHLLICRACTTFNHEVLTAVAAVADGRLPVKDVDLRRAVEKEIAVRPLMLPRLMIAPAASLILVGLIATRLFYTAPLPMTTLDSEVVRDYAFFSEYDLWDDLEAVENLASEPGEAS